MVAQVAGRVIWLIGTAVAASAATASIMSYVNRSNVRKASDAGKREGEAREKARQEQVNERSSAATAEILARFKENQKQHLLILALVTVGAACAASLGKLSDQDRIDIEDYVMGVSRSELPDYIRVKVQHAFANPTDVKTAYTQAAICAATQGWAHFDELVQLVTELQSRQLDRGCATFASEWYYLRAVA